jgi:predicted nuclease of predicted toxin-antitoxin system
MKILIDECLPRKLKYELPDHEVKTVPEAGWAGKKNGVLLRLMADEFEVFITIDSNLEDQQQLATQPVAFVVLSAVNNKLETLLPLMPDVRAILETIQPGQVVKITAKLEE